MDAVVLGLVGLAVCLTGIAAFRSPDRYPMPGRVLTLASVIVATASGAYGLGLRRALHLARENSGDAETVEALSQGIDLIIPYLDWLMNGSLLYGAYAFLFTFTKFLVVPGSSKHQK